MKFQQSEALSDLEGAALALIEQTDGATSYFVATQFAGSPADHWSGSAGAVYPMMIRLEKRNLIKGIDGKTGKRVHTVWHLTDAGRDALMAWLTDANRASGMGFDPLRTRLAHLNLMTEAQQDEFLETVTSMIRERALAPSFEGKPWLQKVQATWVAARLHWVMLVQAEKRALRKIKPKQNDGSMVGN